MAQPIARSIVSRKRLLAGAILLAPIVIGSALAPLLARYGPLQTGAGPDLTSPSAPFLMGTDQLGEDIFSQILYGARVGLYVGVLSSLLSVTIALLVGMIAGYVGGWVDEILMRLTDIILSIPSFILIIFVVILFGATVNGITAIIGLVSWAPIARVIRSQVISLREREFVLAAKAMGARPSDVILHEVFPNISLAVIPAVALQIGYGVLTEAGLSFLGLGDPNAASWGRVLQLASTAIFLGDWWSVLFPGIAMVMTILGFNLLGNAFVAILNPKNR
jgi:peptide/nickel transport system permease protein